MHEAHPWVIAQIAPDFTLLDVWALPAEGGPDDFPALVDVLASLDPAESSAASRFLFAARRRLGDWFGWDDDAALPIPGATETTLRDRLPAELRDSATGPGAGDGLRRAGAAFTPVYRTVDEWAAEIANDTVHGVLHVTWVEQGNGRYRGRLAVYVKPRGRHGEIYLKLISPFRHLVVYPALTRQIGRAWSQRLPQ